MCLGEGVCVCGSVDVERARNWVVAVIVIDCFVFCLFCVLVYARDLSVHSLFTLCRMDTMLIMLQKN